MKQIFIQCREDGSISSNVRYLNFASENLATEVSITYPSTYNTYTKQADIFIGRDNTTDFKIGTTSDVFMFNLGEEHLKAGYLSVQPVAYLEEGLITKKTKWETLKIQVKSSLNVIESTANVYPNSAEILQAQIDELSSDVNVIENKLDEISIPRYNDVTFALNQTRIGSNLKPDYDYTNVGLLFPQNDTSEIVYFTVQLPHSWKVGTQVYPHIHVRQSQNIQATFRMEYIWYNIGDVIPTVWSTYDMNQYAMPYTSGSILNIIKGANGISGVGKTISSMLKIKLYRTDNVYVGDMLADQFDIHVEIDGFGSQTQYDKL